MKHLGIFSRIASVCVLAMFLLAAPRLHGQYAPHATGAPAILPAQTSATEAGATETGATETGATETGATETDTTSSLVLALGAGYAQYVTPYKGPYVIERKGAGFSLALEWHPGMRLRLAVESGWTTFYSYELKDVETSFGRTDASLRLSAIPLLVVFSMPVVSSFTLHAGTGGYFVRSHATSFAETVDVVRFAQGWVTALSWDHAVVWGFRFGAAVKWYGATEFGDGSLLLQLRAAIPIVSW